MYKAKDAKNWTTLLYYLNKKMQICSSSEISMMDKIECLIESGDSKEASKYSQTLFDKLNTNPRYLYLRGL